MATPIASSTFSDVDLTDPLHTTSVNDVLLMTPSSILH